MCDSVQSVMKNLLTCLILLTMICAVDAQSRLIDRSGTISFFSSTPVEDIEGINKQALAALDTKTGSVAVSMLMKGFHFKKTLMEEHFNENYIESDKYPKATLKGKIENYDAIAFLTGNNASFTVIGDITMHGITKTVEVPITLEKKGANLIITSEFRLTIADFDIDIPKIMINKIAREVIINVSFNFKTGE